MAHCSTITSDVIVCRSMIFSVNRPLDPPSPHLRNWAVGATHTLASYPFPSIRTEDFKLSGKLLEFYVVKL